MEGDRRLADRIPARLTAAEGRKFGLAVGGVFAAFGLIALWRSHPTTATILLPVGGLLLLGGLLVPAQLGPIHRAWMGLAHLLSKVTTPIVMGVLYFLVLTPIGLLRRTFGKKVLVREAVEDSYWVARDAAGRPATHMDRQF